MNGSSNFQAAVMAWRKAVGKDNVEAFNAACHRIEKTTFETKAMVNAIVSPASREEVQECVRIANKFGVAIYPISSGKNWGYGSSVPTGGTRVILSLKRIDRIVAINEKQAYVVVQPGVTQKKMYDYLQQRGSSLWMDATGSSPDCSLIGNIVERGFGHTPYGDHFANICNVEVVLPNGEVIRTGFGEFANSQAKHVYRWGLGPFIDGLFSQSNLGIVTEMTIWLMPKPEFFEAFYFSVEKEGQLKDLIDSLQPLRLNGTIKSAVHIANDYKVINSYRQYPWEIVGNKVPLRPEALKNIWSQLDFGAWNGSGGLYGTKKQVAEAKRQIKKVLRGRVKKLHFLTDRKLNLLEKFPFLVKILVGLDAKTILEIIKPVFGLKKGIPTEALIASVYWRKHIPLLTKTGLDPDRDRCGLLWIAPVAPMDGKHAWNIYQDAKRIMLEFGFEPIISITMITERALDCVISILYDRDVPQEDERAMACLDTLLAVFSSKGYYPYRLGVQDMDKVFIKSEAYQSFRRKLKKSMDPNNIFSPGHYEILDTDALSGKL